jgi:hypothetical protein
MTSKPKQKRFKGIELAQQLELLPGSLVPFVPCGHRTQIAVHGFGSS